MKSILDIIALLIISLSLIILGAIIWQTLFLFFRKIKIKKRFKYGKLGEENAKIFLMKHGFKILGEQVSLFSEIFIAGDSQKYEVKADFLVKKGLKKSIVEVKTGEKATDPASINTRRQLFEYMHLYDVDNIYLFDAEKNELKEINFYSKEKNNNIRFYILLFLTGILIGASIFFILSFAFRCF